MQSPTKFSFEIRPTYSEKLLDELLETLEARGGICHPKGDGAFTVIIPKRFCWSPFFLTIRDCPAVFFQEASMIPDTKLLGTGKDEK